MPFHPSDTRLPCLSHQSHFTYTAFYTLIPEFHARPTTNPPDASVSTSVSEVVFGLVSRHDAGDYRRKVVVDVKVASTDDMSKAFKEKNDKYRERATRETHEKNMVKTVMVPFIISHDGAVHKTVSEGGRVSHRTSRSTGCGWHSVCCGTTS